MTARRPGGDHTAPSRLLHLPQFYRTAAVRPQQGRHEAAVRFSRHPRQGKNRMAPHGHRKATVRPPYGGLAVWLRRCGIAVSEKKFNVKLKKTQGLRWPCGSSYGLHKNRKAILQFEGLRSPYGHRKHAASYMWPWHNWACFLMVKFM